jgi:hypothetical protein
MSQVSFAESYFDGKPMLIAGELSASDWWILRKRLLPGADQTLWKSAFEDYYRQRLSLRYLEPIKALQDYGSFQGEGFSIVAIQCTLIEFLASTIEGKNYRQRPKKGEPPLSDHEYSNSSDMFVRFLSGQNPFKKFFDQDTAEEFYVNVRCPLLHEARTKNGWSIWALNLDAEIPFAPPIDPKQKIIFRDNLQSLFLQFVDEYGAKVISDANLQAAFIRKFDNLAT